MCLARAAYSAGRPSRWEGYLLFKGFTCWLWKAVHERGVEDAGGYGHDADAITGKFTGDGKRHADDTTFGGGVGAALSDRRKLRRKRCDDDATFAVFCWFVLDHECACESDGVEGADEVDIEDACEVF